MNSHGTLFVVPGEEEDQVLLYSPKPPGDAKQVARKIDWTGPESLSLGEGLVLGAEALPSWISEQESKGFHFREGAKQGKH